MNPDSSHYTPEQWADFVRQLTSVEESQGMQAHLDQGCESCKKACHWLKTLAATVASHPSWEAPPPDLVNQAKAVFRPLDSSPSWRDQLETLVARLVLVSSSDWVSQGVRSASINGERLLYRAGRYLIDLTMDQAQSLTGPAEIIGQIMEDEDAAGTRMSGVLVQLYAGTKVLGETETNQFGEFVLQRPGTKASTLRFALPIEGKKIELQLKSGKE